LNERVKRSRDSRSLAAVSDLFDVRVEQVSGATARLHVVAVHPDVGDVPRSKNEAVQMLLEGYREACGWPAPFGPKVGCARDAKLDALVEVFVGRSEQVDKAEYEALEARARGGERLSFGLMMREGTYWKRHPVDVPRALEIAERLIVDLHVESVRNAPRAGASGPDPEAVVVFDVSDASLFARLTPGLSWSSAMYDLAIDLPAGATSSAPAASSSPPPGSANPAAPPATQSHGGGCAGCAMGEEPPEWPGVGVALMAGLLWVRTRRTGGG